MSRNPDPAITLYGAELALARRYIEQHDLLNQAQGFEPRLPP